ncbi:MAG: hypothetical protein WBM43_09055 [Flavobacteriaceae bacterium]
MKKLKIIIPAVICLMLVIAGCKEAADSKNIAKPISEEMESESTTVLTIDPATDPLVVGKEFAKVYSDTLNVQMYEMTMKPDDSIGLHIHPDHSVYVLEGGKMLLYIDGTDEMEMVLETGVGFVSGPLTDAAKNIGDTDIRLLIHEIYRPRE